MNDGKYKINGSLTKLDGTPLPEDEPIMIFRAKDKFLPDLLRKYQEMGKAAGSPEAWASGVQERIDQIETWQKENPDKVHVPD